MQLLPLVIMASLEIGFHKVFLFFIVSQFKHIFNMNFIMLPLDGMSLQKCSTQIHLCISHVMMYTKWSFKVFSSYFDRYHHGIFNCSFPFIGRVRDCSSEESFHLVLKIWKLKSENTHYVFCLWYLLNCNLHFSSNVPNQHIGKT